MEIIFLSIAMLHYREKYLNDFFSFGKQLGHTQQKATFSMLYKRLWFTWGVRNSEIGTTELS